MKTTMPVLVVRTGFSTAAIEMNGVFMGDASPTNHIALPLSNTGDYYIGVNPLCNAQERYYPVVRKLVFADGVLSELSCDDVSAYSWPGYLYEIIISPGVLKKEEDTLFPFIISQQTLWDEYKAVLYYENGLRLSVEKAGEIIFGSVLGYYKTGSINTIDNEILAVICGRANLPENEKPNGYGTLLKAYDKSFNEILSVTGDAVGIERNNALSFTRLNTLLKHDIKQVYQYKEGTFIKKEPSIGFYTCSPAPIEESALVIRAFCDALIHGLYDEAYSYLTPALREGLKKEQIKQCMGDFIACRQTLTRQENTIGLVYKKENGIHPVRVFAFSLIGGKIDNLSEEE